MRPARMLKHHVLHGPEVNHFPTSSYGTLTEDRRCRRRDRFSHLLRRVADRIR